MRVRIVPVSRFLYDVQVFDGQLWLSIASPMPLNDAKRLKKEAITWKK